MENKVYYGEYSLKHWIDLILKENIVLPEYQRYFVWKENKVKELIDALKNKQFVPPVTIGVFKFNGESKNLIIDGQQRLTSILLAYLGLYPDEKTYKQTIENFANENDDDDEVDELDSVIEWTFKKLLEKGNNKDKIKSTIQPGNYKEIDLEIDEDFLTTTFLGFSYLVPQFENENNQQNFFSSVFRNINIQAETLLPQDSRKSLYFLDNGLDKFFDPESCKIYTIKNVSSETKLDFVRYLSLLSQYYKDTNTNRIARGYKPKMEKYYEDYIYSIAGEKSSTMFVEFSTLFPDKKYDTRFANFKNTLNSLDIPKSFSSIIDLDMYFFGLIYETIFANKALDETRKDGLTDELKLKISEFKETSGHIKNPNALKYLRERINASIKIYTEYIKEPTDEA